MTPHPTAIPPLGLPRRSHGVCGERGLAEILTSLGRPATARTRFAIVGVFVIATLGAAGGAQALQRIASLPPVPTHAALWLAWFSWHSVLFPRARRRALRGDRDAAYRLVFPTQILPGVCIGVSLMGGPALHAVLAGAPLASPHQLAVGAAFLLAGATLLLSGFVSIGVASAGFLYEYVDTTEPIVPRGIYGYIRHPLFFGGVLASIGAALAFTTPVAVAGAAVNVTALPLYRLLEDRRLAEVFGMSYRLYSVEVAAFLPWLRAVRIAAERVGR